ncbi:MAG: hypothetical protein HQK77_08010 [Desulfobacterales bacterium]|nr:hypothetical protein [Desulfobacterales bacterium]
MSQFIDLNDLREKQNRAVNEQHALQKTIEGLSRDLERYKNSLTRTHREFIGNESQIKELQQEMFTIEHRFASLDQDKITILDQIKTYQTELSRLGQVKTDRTAEISHITNLIADITKENRLYEDQTKHLAEQINRLKDEKNQLLQEINQFLSNTDLTRDEIEKEFAALNEIFMQRIHERQTLTMDLDLLQRKYDELKSKTSGLSQQIERLESLEHRIGLLHQLREEVSILNQEYQEIESQRSVSDEAKHDKQEKLHQLNQENIEKSNFLATLEKEVYVYQQRVTPYEESNARVFESQHQLDSFSSEMRALITSNETLCDYLNQTELYVDQLKNQLELH